jgi:hypothetical protein
VAKQAIVPVFEDATLEIDSSRFVITSSGLGQGQRIEGYTADLEGVQVRTEMVVNGEPQTVLQVRGRERERETWWAHTGGETFLRSNWLESDNRLGVLQGE